MLMDAGTRLSTTIASTTMKNWQDQPVGNGMLHHLTSGAPGPSTAGGTALKTWINGMECIIMNTTHRPIRPEPVDAIPMRATRRKNLDELRRRDVAGRAQNQRTSQRVLTGTPSQRRLTRGRMPTMMLCSKREKDSRAWTNFTVRENRTLLVRLSRGWRS